MEEQEAKAKEEIKKEMRELKKIIEERDRKERRNNIVIRGLKKENRCMKKVAE